MQRLTQKFCQSGATKENGDETFHNMSGFQYKYRCNELVFIQEEKEVLISNFEVSFTQSYLLETRSHSSGRKDAHE